MKSTVQAPNVVTYLWEVEPRQAEDDRRNADEHKIILPSYFFKCCWGALQEDDGRNK